MTTFTREKRGRIVFIISVLTLALFTVWYLSPISSAPKMPSQPSEAKFSYSVLPGIFLQSLPSTSPSSFDPFNSSFGLITRTYPSASHSSPLPDGDAKSQWRRLGAYLHSLNSASTPRTHYKLLYLARHGEGFHNVAEAYYGTPEWNRYWSRLDGDGTIVWSDAHLTEEGEGQARELGEAITAEREGKGMLEPEEWVVSPLWRCLSTARITWGESGWQGRVVVRERAREVMGVHTCDRRSKLSEIERGFREFRVEEGMTEEDEWWDPEHRETVEERRVRARELLDQIFVGNDDGAGQVVVSVTAHSGIIRAVLEVVGHREWPLETGGMMAVVVEAVKQNSR